MSFNVNRHLLKHFERLSNIFHREYSKFDNSHLMRILSEMSRPLDKHVAEAQKQRKLIKERSSRYAPGTVTLQVLGSGASGSPKSVFMFTDQSRYLFNCGEGTQRLAHEHKMKLARLEHIFFTSANWGNMGGLPGVSLTLQDVGVPKITLHGPPRLDELFTATRKFVVLKDMKIEMAECTKETEYDDAVMTVKYIPLIRKTDNNFTSSTLYADEGSSAEEAIEPDNTDYYAHEISGRREVQNTYIDNLLKEPRNEQLCSMVYICRLKSLPGTLDLQKCVNRGVKPGPVLGLLKNGQDVTLPDGTIVYANDVRTPDDPGPVFIVMDIPDERFLDSLEQCEDFKIHQEGPDTNPVDKPAIIVHFTPSPIMHHERYQAFMKTFSPDTNHLIVNDENNCSGSTAIHRVQRKLNLLDDNIFPIIKDNGVPIEPKFFDSETMTKMLDNMLNLDSETMEHLKKKLNFECKYVDQQNNGTVPNQIHAKTFTAYHLRPRNGLDNSAELKLNVAEYISEAINFVGFPSSLGRLYSIVSDLRLKPRQEYPKIVFFGTGSCIPNKTRNTSGIMIHTDENSCILLDCGEGTFGQMVRFYGRDEIVTVMRNLKAIYLSHLHADHHIGLIGVLQGRRKALGPLENSPKPNHKLYLLAPKQIMSWLWLYDRRFERIVHEIQLVPNSNLNKSDYNFAQLPDDVLDHIGLLSVETCPVKHCPNSFGISVVTKQSKKITYSGDTMPCRELVIIGRGSDLLIHEATMEDDLASEARRKMHSTLGQAVSVGREMKASFTLLTHFSQRYARLPRLSAHVEDSKDVGIAFDNMQLSLDDLEILPHLYTPLKLMFAEHCEELEFRAAKRALKRERARSPVRVVAQTTRSISCDAPSRKRRSSDENSPSAEADREMNSCTITETTEIKKSTSDNNSNDIHDNR